MDPKSDTKHTDDQGVLAISIETIAHATEKTVSSSFALVRDVRGEMVQRVLSVFDWVEGVEQGMLRVARAVVHRSDEVATAWIDANEQVARGVVRALLSTGQGATDFASKAAASLTSTRRDGAVVAQA
jgi:hypothetical protein